MNRLRVLGVLVSTLALASYVVGIRVAYPGRALSIAAFMAGATLAIAGGGE
jgi:hypothetical protein